ncbi:MAG: hypothetical protein V2A65_03230 [Candidatus Omnitrophota bacterium]
MCGTESKNRDIIGPRSVQACALSVKWLNACGAADDPELMRRRRHYAF